MTKSKSHTSILSGAVILTLALSVLGTPGAALSTLRDEMRQFHDFLQDHPKVSTELRNNPNLVNSKKYLDKHEDLAKFLKRHPAVKREIVDHPRRAFSRYYVDDHRWADR
jgi:hypothetical protein